MDPQDVERLTKAIDKLSTTATKLETSANSQGSNSNVTINAGGFGVWAAVTCVLVLAVMNFNSQRTVFDLERKYERMQDYLSAIYAQAPQLKPKEETK